MFVPPIYFLVLFLALSFSMVKAEIEMSVDGTGVGSESVELSVRIRSDYSGSMKLWWSGNADDSSPVFILDLQQGVEANVNTFAGHSFFASSPDGMRAQPDRITVCKQFVLEIEDVAVGFWC